MAEERQKRLLIKEYDLVCDLSDCESCEEKDWCNEKDTMTRQDAIKRMGKVIRKKLFKNEGPTQKIKEEGLEQEYNKYVDFMCDYIAESALNALLEGK